MIQMKDVSKIYDNGVEALSKVSIDIGKGEFIFVVGPSGAGKSTFIKMLLLQEKPTKGKIILYGQNLMELREREIPYLRRSMGVVFQDFKLLANKTISENIAFALEVIETPRREIRRRVNNVLDLVGLSAKARVLPSELSGGEQQRVAIARAIINNP
ncbi:MAG: cell division ATP-binding protein FtsE, partial [bacterium]